MFLLILLTAEYPAIQEITFIGKKSLVPARFVENVQEIRERDRICFSQYLFHPLASTIKELRGCSHGKITTVIYFSQLVDCMGFSVVVVAIVSCEHLN